MTSLTIKNGNLILQTPYDAGLVNALKSEIPLHGRAWNPSEKVWEIAYMYGHDVVSIVKQHLNVELAIPKQHTQATPVLETRILKIEYIGAGKERENGDLVAMGYCDGNWSVVLPVKTLRDWFEGGDSQPAQKPSLFAVLGVNRNADNQEIKKAYRIAAKTWHPDINDDPGAPEQFRAIQHAYEILSNETQRRKYLAGLKLQQDAMKQRGENTLFDDSLYRAPKRCGILTVDCTKILNRYVVERILFWDDITENGMTMISYWPKGGDHFAVDWI